MGILFSLKKKILRIVKTSIIDYFLKNTKLLLFIIRSTNKKHRPAAKYFSLLLVLAMFHDENKVKEAAETLLLRHIEKDKWNEIKSNGTLIIKDYLGNTNIPFNSYFNLNHFQFWRILLSEYLPNFQNNQVLQLSSKNINLISCNGLFPNLLKKITTIGLRLEGNDSLDKVFQLLNQCTLTKSIEIYSDDIYHLSSKELFFFNKEYLFAKNFEFPNYGEDKPILENVENLEWVFKNEICYRSSIFPNLSTLDLLGTKIQEIELSKNTVRLKELILSVKEQTTIPNCVYDCVNLKTLHIHDSNISNVSSKISSLENLKTICLSNTYFTEFPIEFMLAPKLEFIYKLSPPTNGDYRVEKYKNLNELSEIDWSPNSVKTFPYQLSALKNLKSMYFAGCQMFEIDERIANFMTLESLHFDQNKLTRIPNYLKLLPNIKNLTLWCNEISELSFEWITHVNKKNITLNLTNNPINNLPPIPIDFQSSKIIKNNGEIIFNKGTLSKTTMEEYRTIFGDQFIKDQ